MGERGKNVQRESGEVVGDQTHSTRDHVDSGGTYDRVESLDKMDVLEGSTRTLPSQSAGDSVQMNTEKAVQYMIHD